MKVYEVELVDIRLAQGELWLGWAEDEPEEEDEQRNCG